MKHSDRPPSRRVAALLVALLLLVTALAVWFGRYVPFVEEYVDRLGPYGPFAFVAACVVAAVLAVPGSALKMSAGVLFGFRLGVVWAFVGSYLGALAAFAIARRAGRAYVARRIGERSRLARFDRAIASEPRTLVALLRLSPAVPYNVINYVLGASRIRFADYALASTAMAPSVVMYVYAGDVARQVTAVATGGADKPWWEWASLVVGAVATLVLAVFVGRRARRALRVEDDVVG